MGISEQGETVQWPAVKLGPAVRSHGLTFFPILEEGARQMDYLLLQDAIQEKVAAVTEVGEEGSIPVLEVENRYHQPVLVLQGEELIGAKQNRTLNVTLLLPPGRTRIPVTCVEQGRWGYRSREFSSGMFEHLDLRRRKAEMVTSSRKRAAASMFARYEANQSEVWQEIREESARQAVYSDTGALGDVYSSDRVRRRLDEIEAHVRLPEASRGVVVGVGKNVVAVELLETARVFRRVWPRLLRSYALSSISTRGEREAPGAGSPSAAEAEAWLSLTRSLAPSVLDSIGLGKDVRWEGPVSLASALVHEGRMLHGTVYRRPPSTSPHMRDCEAQAS